jgi:hypothetical protein
MLLVDDDGGHGIDAVALVELLAFAHLGGISVCGLRILDKIRSLRHRTLRQRPQLGKWDVCVVLWRALWM